MMKKEDYMALALKEAEKGMGFVAPNPLVGAVIVKDDRIISKGYHKRFGDLKMLMRISLEVLCT